jgi:hypothetical protein
MRTIVSRWFCRWRTLSCTRRQDAKVKTMLLFAALLLTGCCTQPTPGYAPVSTVVDKLKDELNLFDSAPPIRPLGQGGQTVCPGVNGQPIVLVIPTKAQLVLKVVSTNTYGANVGAKIPAGSIVTVDPSVSGTYQTQGTQALTLDLDVQHKKSAEESRSDIDLTSKQIELYDKAQKKYSKSNPSLAKQFGIALRKRNADLDAMYVNLGASLSSDSRPIYGSGSAQDQPPPSLKDHDLAATLWTLRQQLLNVNHTSRPCVKPSQLKTEIDFEVVSDAKASLGLDIYIVSVGASAEGKKDTVQTLTVTFDMTGSSLLLQ